jgi:hypothetical protein
MYLQLKKQGQTALWQNGLWPLFLKTVALPLSDQAFVERQKSRLARGSSTVAYFVYEQAKQIVAGKRKAKEMITVLGIQLPENICKDGGNYNIRQVTLTHSPWLS